MKPTLILPYKSQDNPNLKMMKLLFFILVVTCCLSACSAEQDNEDQWPAFPPKTEEWGSFSLHVRLALALEIERKVIPEGINRYIVFQEPWGDSTAHAYLFYYRDNQAYMQAIALYNTGPSESKGEIVQLDSKIPKSVHEYNPDLPLELRGDTQLLEQKHPALWRRISENRRRTSRLPFRFVDLYWREQLTIRPWLEMHEKPVPCKIAAPVTISVDSFLKLEHILWQLPPAIGQVEMADCEVYHFWIKKDRSRHMVIDPCLSIDKVDGLLPLLDAMRSQSPW